MISQNVMKNKEFDDSIYYTVACSCGSDEHNATIEFGFDKDVPDMIFLNFYKNVAWCSSWGNRNFFSQIWYRISGSLKMLFTGYIELEESFLIEDELSIDGFIEALQEGKEYIKRKKEEQNNNAN